MRTHPYIGLKTARYINKLAAAKPARQFGHAMQI